MDKIKELVNRLDSTKILCDRCKKWRKRKYCTKVSNNLDFWCMSCWDKELNKVTDAINSIMKKEHEQKSKRTNKSIKSK